MFHCIDPLKYSSKLITNSFKSDLIINLASFQSIRWKRKPIWLPTAKSRMFKIPERPKVDEREAIELKRLHNRYKTHMHAIRTYFLEEIQETSAKSTVAIQEVKDEEDEHIQCMKINEEWNQQVSLIREDRLKKDEEIRREKVLRALAIAEEKRNAEKERIEQLVREEKERSKFYITPENIDKAIDEALGSIVDHNFAIDTDGNIFRGRTTKPSDVPPEERTQIQVPIQA
ncbi:putative 28S ribosomal protein S26 [Blattella germanica]|nr:putative 28S ribosomal protein S26 [Blattella germanica]